MPPEQSTTLNIREMVATIQVDVARLEERFSGQNRTLGELMQLLQEQNRKIADLATEIRGSRADNAQAIMDITRKVDSLEIRVSQIEKYIAQHEQAHCAQEAKEEEELRSREKAAKEEVSGRQKLLFEKGITLKHAIYLAVATFLVSGLGGILFELVRRMIFPTTP